MIPDPQVIFATDRFVVADKPAWLLSVPGKSEKDCVPARLARILGRTPLAVHRLDMETSGLLVLALDADAHRTLSRQFEERRVAKAYIALVEGSPADDHGRIDLPVRANLDDRPRQVIDFENGREAITLWSTLSHETDRTRIRFEPETGRTHQLRIHAAAPAHIRLAGRTRPGGLGCPIVGDGLYGTPGPRLMLHASELSFVEPGGTRRLEFRSPSPF